MRRRRDRSYSGTLTLPRRPGAWPTPPAETATAAPAPAPALTAVRALRASWPAPSSPTFAAGGRNLLQGNGHFRGNQDARPPTHPVSNGCSSSPALSVTRCNDMRKIAARWTCGHTFWVWRLRERNFCSGKCRVRHRRSALRKPRNSAPGRTLAGAG